VLDGFNGCCDGMDFKGVQNTSHEKEITHHQALVSRLLLRSAACPDRSPNARQWLQWLLKVQMFLSRH
jgi:hypothetical protein